MSKIKYKTLYLDFLEYSKDVKESVKPFLITLIKKEKSEAISFKKLHEINELISNSSNISGSIKRYQQLKSYDTDFIKFILSYQKEYKLSNNQISLEFKLSRNTISKWKKEFN